MIPPVQAELPIVIAPMGAEDLDRVLQIEVRSFTMPWTPEMFATQRDRLEKGEVFVARAADGEPAGVIGYLCLWLAAGDAHIDNIAVDPACRRRGVAGRLVRFAMEWARRHGARLLTLEVRSTNHAAQALYRCFGFAVVGTRRNYYEKPREDALIMTLMPIPAPDGAGIAGTTAPANRSPRTAG